MGNGVTGDIFMSEAGSSKFIKEPDFQIRITQEACSTLMETSPDTENMVFFPNEFLENIKQTAGNSLRDETQIQGSYPIVGENGRDSIKLLNDGETVPTVIQKISSSEKEKLQEFLKSDSLTEHLKKGCSEEDIVYQRRSEKNSETYVWMEVKRFVDENENYTKEN